MGRNSVFLVVAFALTTAVLACGCKKSESTDSGQSGGGAGAAASAGERAAQDAALAELQRHWLKGSDGWTTARTSGSAYAPDRYLRQLRELKVRGVQSEDLTDSDRLNGLEWAGEVSFEPAPCREAGDSGIILEGLASVTVNRPRGQWSQWVDFQPEPLRLKKVKGQWQFNQDQWLLRGALPGPQDFASAGVK